MNRKIVKSESEMYRKWNGRSSNLNRKLEFKMQKHGSATAFPTVQLEKQVRGKDVSFPYHHALTVSSLGSDCQACTAPLLVNFEVENANSNMSESDGKCKSEISTSCSIKHVVFPRRWPRKIRHRVTRCLHTHTHTHGISNLIFRQAWT